MVGWGSIFIVLGVDFGAILETLRLNFGDFGLPGAPFLRSGRPFGAPWHRDAKNNDFLEKFPPGWVPALGAFLGFFEFVFSFL